MAEQGEAKALVFRHPSRHLLIPVISLLALLAVLTPVIAALIFARQQSFSSEQHRAQFIADEVLRRTDATRSQMSLALEQLHPSPAPEPCSLIDMQHMAGAVLRYEFLQGAGFVRDGKLICTSAGMLFPPIDLGPPEFQTANGYGIRRGVQLPFAPDVKLIVLSDGSGYTIFVHPGLTLDIPLNSESEAIGVISISTGKVVNERGLRDEGLLDPFRQARTTNYVKNGRLVSIVPSKSGDYAGFSVIPMDEVTKEFKR